MLDPRSESVGEWVSRVVLAERGIVAPEPRYSVCDRMSHLVARCDFAWPGLRTLGEFDGQVEYGQTLAPGGDLGRVL